MSGTIYIALLYVVVLGTVLLTIWALGWAGWWLADRFRRGVRKRNRGRV